MKEVNYLSNAYSALKLLKSRPILFLPDLFAAISWSLLLFLLIYLNNLFHISYLNPRILLDALKSIVNNSPKLINLIITFIISITLAFAVHLGAISMRYILIRSYLRKEDITLLRVYIESGKYFIPLFLLKIFFFIVYLIPTLIVAFLAIKFDFSVFISSFLSLLLLALLSIIFIFIYAELMLKDSRNPFKVVKSAIIYFKNNSGNCIITFAIITFFSLVFSYIIYSLLLNSLSSFLNNKLGISLVLTALLWVIRTLLVISLDLWKDIFTFKNF